MKKITDGWHEIAGYSVYVEVGYIVRGTKNNDTEPAYVYRWNKRNNAWVHVDKITPSAFRAGLQRGSISMM